MKYVEYFKDKFLSVAISFLTIIIILLLLLFLDAHILLIVFIPIILLGVYFVIFIYNYARKRDFYNSLKTNLDSLDKKYFITEILKKPSFLDGEIFLDSLYEIDKSYIEELDNYKYNSMELKEYIELWCHEIKTPIATSKLIMDNNKNEVTDSILEEIEKIESYVEQVLYYARSENVEKDYIIKKVDLKNIIQEVIKQNKKSLIKKKIKINIFSNSVLIESDSKWLEFIINQIVSNCIKYCNEKKPIIDIDCKINKNNTMLIIKDNGIGIYSSDISKVFDKGFTGSNGRTKYNSTGIGLYLCKKLCDRLGHSILISSKLDKETIVTIVFPNSSLINEIK